MPIVTRGQSLHLNIPRPVCQVPKHMGLQDVVLAESPQISECDGGGCRVGQQKGEDSGLWSQLCSEPGPAREEATSCVRPKIGRHLCSQSSHGRGDLKSFRDHPEIPEDTSVRAQPGLAKEGVPPAASPSTRGAVCMLTSLCRLSHPSSPQRPSLWAAVQHPDPRHPPPPFPIPQLPDTIAYFRVCFASKL